MFEIGCTNGGANASLSSFRSVTAEVKQAVRFSRRISVTVGSRGIVKYGINYTVSDYKSPGAVLIFSHAWDVEQISIVVLISEREVNCRSACSTDWSKYKLDED